MDKEIKLGRFDKWGYKNSFSKGELARELTYMNRDYDKLEQKVQKQKEVISRAVKYIDDLRDESAERQGFYNCFPDDLYIPDINELLDILKEVSE